MLFNKWIIILIYGFVNCTTLSNLQIDRINSLRGYLTNQYVHTITSYFVRQLHYDEVYIVSENLPFNKKLSKNLLNCYNCTERYLKILVRQNEPCRLINFQVIMLNHSFMLSVHELNQYHCSFSPITNLEYDNMIEFIKSIAQKFNITMGNLMANDDSFNLMPVSPLYTVRWGDKRQTWLRINANTIPFDTNPTSLQLLIDFTNPRVTNWNLSQIWLGNKMESIQNWNYTNKILPNISKWPYLFNKSVNIHRNCPFIRRKPTLSLENGRVSFKKWRFTMSFSEEIGIKLMDLKFQETQLAHEISIQEIATSYSGYSPFIQTMTSIESMYNIGTLIFDLAAGLDCPSNAKYFSFTKYFNNTSTEVVQGVCVFYRVASLPIRRHFSFNSLSNMKFGNGLAGYELYMRYIISLYNYDYIVDHIFYETGHFDVSITPTGYIHVDYKSGTSDRRYPTFTPYGYEFHHQNLHYPLHVHMFFVKVDLDIVDETNQFRIIETKLNDSLKMGNKVYMTQKLVESENDSMVHYNFEMLRRYLFCKVTDERHRCLEVKNKAMIPDILSSELDESIYWKTFQMAVTKRRENETRGSSSFNGVNLLNSSLNFKHFLDNNDNLVDEDLVLWSSLGGQHSPSTEDVPNTLTGSNSYTLSFNPVNLFDKAPCDKSDEEFYTTIKEEWRRGIMCDEE